MAASSAAAAASVREKRNWLIHHQYVRREFDRCLEIIEEQLQASQGLAEYAIYVKGLIRRQQGRIQESLQLFQAATCLNPRNPANVKQVGRSLYLLGKHRSAIQVYEEAEDIGDGEDWEIPHNKGLCFMYLKQFDRAVDEFQAANSIQRHEESFMQLARVYMMQNSLQEAVDALEEAQEFYPESSDVLTTLGLLHLRMQETVKAFEYLGNSLTHDPRDSKTILAASSIIQDNGDMDVALVKYRIAAVYTPNSAELWNNVGMCFFGKQKYVAAIACLKRALYLKPFEWIIAYNLGIVHLNTQQFASAFHYFSTSINLNAEFASAYHYLAVTLVRLEDEGNAFAAYEKALEIEEDHTIRLNYAVSLYHAGRMEEARAQLSAFMGLWKGLDEETQQSDPDVVSTRDALALAVNYMPE